MDVTYDPTTPRGTVRLLIGDTDHEHPENLFFTDEEIDRFLALEGDSIRLAAALALETMASSEALVSKKIRLQDLQTDGPAVAAELRARAAELRAQEDDSVAADDDDFAIAELVVDPFTERQRLANELARGS